MKKPSLNIPVQKLCMPLFLSFLLLSLISCIGISIDIQMNRDGSGRLSIEYTYSNFLEELGMLDGYESMPPIPAGRVDWERTAERIEGAQLISHSVRETSQNKVVTAVIDFLNPEALMALLEPSSDKVTITHNRQPGGSSLNLVIFEKIEPTEYDDDLITLAHTIFAGYNLSVSFTAPGNCAMVITDGDGNRMPAPASAITSQQGRRVSFTASIMDVIGIEEGLGLVISW